jgi:hypothetical protein
MNSSLKNAPPLKVAALGLAALAAVSLLSLAAAPARADVIINNADTGYHQVTLDSPDYPDGSANAVTSAATNGNGDTLTVATGGSVQGSGYSSPAVQVAFGTADITGGSVTNSGDYGEGVLDIIGTVDITGGSVTASGMDGVAVFNDSGTVDITGGTFNASDDLYAGAGSGPTGVINLYGQFYQKANGTDPYADGTSLNVGSGTVYADLEDGGLQQNLTYFVGDSSIILHDVPPAASPAPEPSQIGMLALMGLGLGGLMLRARRRYKAA